MPAAPPRERDSLSKSESYASRLVNVDEMTNRLGASLISGQPDYRGTRAQFVVCVAFWLLNVSHRDL